MGSEDYSEWVKQEQKRFNEKAEQLEKRLWKEKSVEVKNTFKRIKKELYEKEVLTKEPINALGQKEKQRVEWKLRNPPPGAMEKVDAEYKKLHEIYLAKKEVTYETTRQILREKEKYQSTLNEKEAALFEKALNVKEDRAFVTKYEAERNRVERMRDSVPKAKEKDILPKGELHKELLEGERKTKEQLVREDRPVKINHQEHDWVYEKKGNEERFLAKDDGGKTLMVIEKIDKNREFTAKDNAGIIEHEKEPKVEQKGKDLETVFEEARPKLDRIKEEENQRNPQRRNKDPKNRDDNNDDGPNDGGLKPDPDDRGPKPSSPGSAVLPPKTEKPDLVEEEQKRRKFIRKGEEKEEKQDLGKEQERWRVMQILSKRKRGEELSEDEKRISAKVDFKASQQAENEERSYLVPKSRDFANDNDPQAREFFDDEGDIEDNKPDAFFG
jgi:hypothetical protein